VSYDCEEQKPLSDLVIQITANQVSKMFLANVAFLRVFSSDGVSKHHTDCNTVLDCMNFSCIRFLAAVGFLLFSSAVTMTVPFGIGHVIDIIYTTTKEGDMVGRLTQFCQILLVLFFLGAVANFARIYLMQTSGKCFFTMFY
jgi:ABC-type multidrug transport system fused ATPase/permease subunit